MTKRRYALNFEAIYGKPKSKTDKPKPFKRMNSAEPLKSKVTVKLYEEQIQIINDIVDNYDAFCICGREQCPVCRLVRLGKIKKTHKVIHKENA